jgi:hypothetical protein
MTEQPSESELRWAGPSLQFAAIGAAMQTVIEGAERVSRYFVTAGALGVSQERAQEILQEAQGLAAGSTPTKDELDRARQLLYPEGAGE